MVEKKTVLDDHKEQVQRNRMGGSRFWKGLALVLFVLLVVSNVYSGGLPDFGTSIYDEDAVAKSVAFINERLLAGLATAEIVAVNEEEGFYKIDLLILSPDGTEQDFTSYVTKDGNLLFPSAVDLSEFDYVADDTELVDEVLDLSEDPLLGSADALVHIVAWSDYDCESCQSAYWAYQLVQEEYADDVSLVFKHFPSSAAGVTSAVAAECAQVQGSFEGYYNLLFENPAAHSVDDLKQYAADLDLDTEAFDNCLDTAETAAAIAIDIADGETQGVNEVPSFWINDKLYVGLSSFGDFQEIIDPLLEVAEDAGEEVVEEAPAEDAAEDEEETVAEEVEESDDAAVDDSEEA